MDCSPSASSVPGNLQARILEWTAMLSSRDLPDPGFELVSLTSPALAGGFLPLVPPGKPCTLLGVCIYMEGDHWAKHLPNIPQGADRRPHLGFSDATIPWAHTVGQRSWKCACASLLHYSLLLPLALPLVWLDFQPPGSLYRWHPCPTFIQACHGCVQTCQDLQANGHPSKSVNAISPRRPQDTKARTS